MLKIVTNKDLGTFKKNVFLGLDWKELKAVALAVIMGTAVILFTYKKLGIYGAVYCAVPFSWLISMNGFFKKYDMSYKDYIKRKIHFLFFNRPYIDSSTESEEHLDEIMDIYEREKQGDGVQGTNSEFEKSVRRMKMLLAIIILAIIVTGITMLFLKSRGTSDKIPDTDKIPVVTPTTGPAASPTPMPAPSPTPGPSPMPSPSPTVMPSPAPQILQEPGLSSYKKGSRTLKGTAQAGVTVYAKVGKKSYSAVVSKKGKFEIKLKKKLKKDEKISIYAVLEGCSDSKKKTYKVKK